MTRKMLRVPGFVGNDRDGMSCLHAYVQDDLRQAPNTDWNVISPVNRAILDSHGDTCRHGVFIYGYDATGVLFHDPGLPPMPDRHAPWELCEQAWSSPVQRLSTMTCVRVTDSKARQFS